MNNTTVKSANNFFTQFAVSPFYTEGQHNSTLFIQNINGLFDENKPIESVFDGFIYFSKSFYKHTVANTFQNVSPYLNKGCLLFWSNGNDHLIAFASNNYDAAQDSFDLLFFTNTIGVNAFHERKSINQNSILLIDTATISANFSGGTLPLLGIVETDYKQPKGFYIGGDLEQAKKDIISLIHKDKRLTPTPINTVSTPPTASVSDSKIRISFVMVSESTKILRVMLTNAEQHKENSIGAKLLLNLTTANERYLYQVAIKSINADGKERPLTDPTTNGITNKSITSFSIVDKDFGQKVMFDNDPNETVVLTPNIYESMLENKESIQVSVEKKPIEGNVQKINYEVSAAQVAKFFKQRLIDKNEKVIALDVARSTLQFDGIVTIHPTVSWLKLSNKLNPTANKRINYLIIIPRTDVVFHELWESWERTTNKEAYCWLYLRADWRKMQTINQQQNRFITLFNLDEKAVTSGGFMGAHIKSLNAVPIADKAIKKPRDVSQNYTTFSTPVRSSTDTYYTKIEANTWERSTEPKTTSETNDKGWAYEYDY